LLFSHDPLWAVSAATAAKYAGMATMAFGIVSLLAAQALSRVAGSYLVISSGTLLAAIGFRSVDVTAGLLFYLACSTLAASALYLIIEPIERNAADNKALKVFEPVFEDEYLGGPEDEEQETEAGVAFSATVALLGGGFILVAALLAGLPPLPSFLAKFTVIDALVRGDGQAGSWTMIALMFVSGFTALITMTRAGIDLLWKPADRPPIRINIIEAAPIGLLLGACVALTVWAGPMMDFMQRTAQELDRPSLYVESVLGPASAAKPPR
jgi:multicomponent K+:H+ antiporter subunit D